MSSTNRGRDRSLHDYYVTPVPAIEHFLKHFLKHEPGALDGVVLDPCAGGTVQGFKRDYPGDLRDRVALGVAMSYPEAIRNVGIKPQKLVTMDIRFDSLAKIKTDFLNTTIMAAVDCVITNPPFGLAVETINRSLDIVKPGGWVIMLLRLNYFGAQKRREFWQRNMPTYAFVHSERMSFTADGKTDSTEYMHACWQVGNHPEFCKTCVI